VSTDGGATWTSLENEFTVYDYDPNAHPDIIANLPGLTGWSGGWMNISYDLSAYAGQNILVAFRYMTDWGTTYEGWYIDNVYVDGTLISDGSDASVFKSLTELFPIEMDFTVQLVGIKERGSRMNYQVTTLKLDDATEEGSFLLKNKFENVDYIVMLVTFDAPEGVTEYGDYEYSVK
jgi:immune inhibitor A